MSSRTTTSTVPFLHPFMVTGYADELPAGEYEVLADDEVILSPSSTACRRTARFLLIKWPAGKSERRTMDQQGLELALAHDQANANTTVTKNSEAALSPSEDRKSQLTEPRGPYASAACTPAQPPTVMALFVGSILAVMLFVLPAFAQTNAQPMPENASARSYGDGWECNIGVRLDENACVAVIVPQNAYDTNRSYGSGWECLHGFRRTDDAACVAVEVPEGGFLDPSGEQWRCLRGYIKVDDTCQEIVLPADAYLVDASYGSAWTCERGFEATDGQCTAIAVPANAYLNGSGYGQPWTCERGFFEQAGLCEAVVIPANAYFDDASYGTGWKCDREYVASAETCDFINVPENAHLDRSGN